MNAFRFLSLLTVGFSLLVLVFLLNATHGRMEAEATRWIEGPEVLLEPGEEVEWTLNLGASRIEEAWPAPQRQPRLFLLTAAEEGAAGSLAGAQVTVSASYRGEDGASYPAFVAGANASGGPGESSSELAFGPLWMSWDHELSLKAVVAAAPGSGAGAARFVLRGEATKDYVAARSMARTLWLVFTAIAAVGFVGLMLTVNDRSSELA
jgi:hypothetical protein